MQYKVTDSTFTQPSTNVIALIYTNTGVLGPVRPVCIHRVWNLRGQQHFHNFDKSRCVVAIFSGGYSVLLLISYLSSLQLLTPFITAS